MLNELGRAGDADATGALLAQVFKDKARVDTALAGHQVTWDTRSLAKKKGFDSAIVATDVTTGNVLVMKVIESKGWDHDSYNNPPKGKLTQPVRQAVHALLARWGDAGFAYVEHCYDVVDVGVTSLSDWQKLPSGQLTGLRGEPLPVGFSMAFGPHRLIDRLILKDKLFEDGPVLTIHQNDNPQQRVVAKVLKDEFSVTWDPVLGAFVATFNVHRVDPATGTWDPVPKTCSFVISWQRSAASHAEYWYTVVDAINAYRIHHGLPRI